MFRRLRTKQRRRRSLDEFDNDFINELKHDSLVDWVEQQQVKKRVKRDIMFYRPVESSLLSKFNDPEWDKQWYMVNVYPLFLFCGNNITKLSKHFSLKA